MNKLEGFFKLKETRLPTVNWVMFGAGDKLSPDFLWTVRCAKLSGADFSLPRKVGAKAEEAEKFAEKLYAKLGGNGIVITYPFFVAEMSGVIIADSEKCEIECVLGDLWNLVEGGAPDFSAVYDLKGNKVIRTLGDMRISENDEKELLNYAGVLRLNLREEIAEGKRAYAEWSYAFDCGADGSPTGSRHLIFYELRTI